MNYKEYELFFDSLKKGLISLDDVDLDSMDFFNSQKISLINFSRNKMIKNSNNIKVLMKWENDLINSKVKLGICNNKYNYELSININISNIDDVLNSMEDVEELFFDETVVDCLNEVINKIKSSKKNIKRIVVALPYFKTIEAKILNNINNKEMVYFSLDDNQPRFSVDDLIKIENTLELFVRDIKNSTLSPYERYVAVYNLVRTFKNYKESTSFAQSSHPYLIILNEYIVCSGYSELLTNLLKRVNVNSMTMSVFNKKKNRSHQRNYVNIVDSKYGIDGYYMCDVTYDHNNKMSSYCRHMNYTTDESRTDETFKDDILCDDFFDDYTNEEMLEYIKINSKAVVRMLQTLDPLFFESIKTNFQNNELDIKLATTINEHLRKKLNHCISIEKQAEATLEMYQFIDDKKYTEEEYKQKWNDYITNATAFPEKYLLGDYKKDIDDYMEKLENISFIEFCNMKCDSPYNDWVFSEAIKNIEYKYLHNVNKILCCFATDGSLMIQLPFYMLENGEKMDNILQEIVNKGYKVETENIDLGYLSINLGSDCFSKKYIEILAEQDEIINIFLNAYDDTYDEKNEHFK